MILGMSGNFECDDKELNTLWNMANRTLYLNMRDTYMDCPDRERAMWIGDLSIEMEEAMYGLDTSANALYEKCIKTVLGWRHEEVFCTVSPSIFNGIQLPVQNLLSIVSMYNYYEYTGNVEFLENIYSSVKQYMKLWNFGDNGLVLGGGNYYWNLWQWHDSQGITDDFLIENFWYYYSMQNMQKMAEVLGKNHDAKDYKQKLDKMKEGLNKEFWDGKGYRTNEYDGYKGYDVRANALAVLTDVVDESNYDKIFEVIFDNYDNSTFMEKYVLESLSKMGKIDIVQKRIKERYNEMIANEPECSTLWEYWYASTGSKNHAWAGGPLVIMSKYFAGIKPLKPGYEEIQIKPDFGTLKKINSKVNTVKGEIVLKAEKNKKEIILEVNVPEKTLVAVEKLKDDYNISINNKEIYKAGEFKDNKLAVFEKEDNKYIYLFLEKGNYKVISN